MYRTVCIFWYHPDRYYVGTYQNVRLRYRLGAVILTHFPMTLDGLVDPRYRSDAAQAIQG
eukprot:SAG11_NODE_15920_length_562_cov_2.483801_1_plen_60_part_00